MNNLEWMLAGLVISTAAAFVVGYILGFRGAYREYKALDKEIQGSYRGRTYRQSPSSSRTVRKL